ncbi:MAG: hypothetical protein C4519_17180 [Desulfobacteraceae bacterium]|nr:MAG: hypothetical protein C4519_17180 [Desulfobacteraceae bacterium]
MNNRARIIEPEAFKAQFEAAVKVLEQRIIGTRLGSHDLTRLFVGPEGVLELVAKRLELTPMAEYYKYDMVMFAEKDTEHFYEQQTYAKVLNVVVEHELKWGMSVEEMNKLTQVNAPLRVLITYPNSEEEQEVIIRKFEKILRYADWAGDIATSRQVLIICGGVDENRTYWDFYTYQNTGLVKI